MNANKVVSLRSAVTMDSIARGTKLTVISDILFTWGINSSFTQVCTMTAINQLSDKGSGTKKLHDLLPY